jgi:cysteine-rich repeat protein
VIKYRTSAKPPLLSGSIQPPPVLILDTKLAGCPVCGNREIDAGETCDDGNRLGGDGCSATCQDEGCVAATPGYPTVSLCDDGESCTADACNTQLHVCEHVRSCDDGNSCTVDACVNDTCVHTPNDALCNSGTVCAHGLCNAVTGCVFQPVVGFCDDGNFCNGSDACAQGSCSSHTGDPCAGLPECRNVCDEALDRCQTPVGTPCSNGGRLCTVGLCNGFGRCDLYDDNGVCDDGLFCNGADACAAGQCGAHAGDPCTGECRETCNESTRTCGDPAGFACSGDNNFCTRDVCDGEGGCTHEAYQRFSSVTTGVLRVPGADNDLFTLKAVFKPGAVAVLPTSTGLMLVANDSTGRSVFSSELPASGFADVKGDGTQFRYYAASGALAAASGVYSVIVRRNPAKDVVAVRLRGRGYDVPGIVGQPDLSVALGFGSNPGLGACVGDVKIPCAASGSRVSCRLRQ